MKRPNPKKKKGLSTEDLKKQYEESQSFGRRAGYTVSDVDVFKPRDGENCIRIVPPIELHEIKSYSIEAWVHFSVGINNTAFLCRKEMQRKRCYICEQATPELWEEDEEKAKSYWPGPPRRLIWICDLKSDEPEKLLLWSCPSTLYKEILGQSRKRDQDIMIDVSDEDSGVPVYFDKHGKGLRTKYSNVQLGEEAIPLDESVLDQRRTFEDAIIISEYKEVKQEFLNTEEEGSEDYNAEEEPEEPEPEEEGNELKTYTDQLDGLDRAELKLHIKSEGLSVKVFKSMSDDDIREKIREIESSEEEEPEPEEEEPENTSFLDEMNRDELKMMIKNDGLDIKVFKNMSDEDIREKIRGETGNPEEEPEGDTELEDKKEAAKAKIKAAIAKNKGRRVKS